MTTTIKIKERVKDGLDIHKIENESYSDVIAKLLKKINRTNLKEKLTEGYSSYDRARMKEFKEWEPANL